MTFDTEWKRERNFSPEGPDDLALLDNINEESVTSALQHRYANGDIYSYLGPLLVCVNPFQQMELYENEVKNEYHNSQPYELSPHIYSQAEAAFREMLATGQSQTVIISGESGAGKTESSKIFMNYLADVSMSGNYAAGVKQRILGSNPVLEAFGNAKTLRNDNSSRFGKYMDLYFNFKGQLEGGHITTSLLEKARVVGQKHGERNFHIFYQICAGADDILRRELGLAAPNKFDYLSRSKTLQIPGVDDRLQFKITEKSMNAMGITTNEQMEIFRIVAAVLHLGNIKFEEVHKDNKEQAEISNPESLTKIAQVLRVDRDALEKAILYKAIHVRAGNKIETTYTVQNASMASFNRDALAKGIYERLFLWLIKRVNAAIVRPPTAKYSIGILDIYGFEIYEMNSLEQLCINYTNEKIQELIQHKVREEEDEYINEGIAWERVKAYNCEECIQLIEERPLGIFALLDEEALMPNGRDLNYLDKCNKTFVKNKMYTVPKFKRPGFGIAHFAAKVDYDVTGWVEKNKDTLIADLIYAMQNSDSELVKQLFPKDEIIETKGKLHTTFVQKFKTQVNNLTAKMTGKKHHFIRCVKPNDLLKPQTFDKNLVANQVKYLGLVENIHLRKQGFHFTMDYDTFLDRYKVCCEETWPAWKGDVKQGCEKILKKMKLDGKYAMGKTKLFIQSPVQLNVLDDCKYNMRDYLATTIQKTWKMHQAKKVFMIYMHLLQTLKDYGEEGIEWKAYANEYDPVESKWQRKMVVVGKNGVYVVNPHNYAVTKRIEYSKLKQVMASGLADDLFILQEADLDTVFESDMKTDAIKRILDSYVRLTSDDLKLILKDRFEIRPSAGVVKQVKYIKKKDIQGTTVRLTEDGIEVDILATGDMFCGQKKRRKASFNKQMHGDYLHMSKTPLLETIKADGGDAHVYFSGITSKFDMKFKGKNQICMITDQAVYILDPRGYMINRKIPLAKIANVTVSPLTDGYFVLTVPDEEDCFFESNKKTEIMKNISDAYSKLMQANLKIDIKNEMKLCLKKGKVCTVAFREDPDIDQTTLIVTTFGAEIRVKPEEVVTGDLVQDIDMIKDIYKGDKLRKRETLLRWFMGDYLHFDNSEWFKKIKKQHNDQRIVFSGLVNKINKKYRIQERVMIITDQAIYNCKKDGDYAILRRIPVSDVHGVCVSSMRDGFFILRVPNDYDYMMESFKKTEIVKAIMDQYKEVMGADLDLFVENSFQYCPIKKTVKNIDFIEDNTIGGAVLEPSTYGVKVRVCNIEEIQDSSGQNIQQGHIDDGQSPFNRQKFRRRESMERNYMGDYLNLNDSPQMKKLFKIYGDKVVLFSDNLSKYNEKYKKQERTFIVTDKAVYNVDPDGFQVKRRIKLDDIDGVSLSSLTDGHFVLHIPTEYDVLFESDKKTEIIDILKEAISKTSGRDLKINIGDKFEYRPGGNDIKEITFIMDEEMKDTSLEATSNGLIIHVVHEEPPVVLEAAWLHIKNQDKPIEVKANSTLKLAKKTKYKMQIRFYVNEEIKNCEFHEKIDTVTQRKEFISKVSILKPREERYVIMLPERDVIYSVLSKTRVKAKLVDPSGTVLLAIRFVYEVK